MNEEAFSRNARDTDEECVLRQRRRDEVVEDGADTHVRQGGGRKDRRGVLDASRCWFSIHVDRERSLTGPTYGVPVLSAFYCLEATVRRAQAVGPNQTLTTTHYY